MQARRKEYEAVETRTVRVRVRVRENVRVRVRMRVRVSTVLFLFSVGLLLTPQRVTSNFLSKTLIILFAVLNDIFTLSEFVFFGSF